MNDSTVGEIWSARCSPQDGDPWLRIRCNPTYLPVECKTVKRGYDEIDDG